MSKEDDRDHKNPKAEIWRIASYLTPIAQQAAERHKHRGVNGQNYFRI